MIKLLNLAVALLLCSAFSVDAQSARNIQLADRIVAVVNAEVITQRDLDERIAAIARQMERKGANIPPRAVLEKQILERMITEMALLQHARGSGLRVEDAAVEAAIKRIAAANKMTPEQFKEAITRDGTPLSKFREDVRTELTMTRLKEREAASKVQVTESEIDNFLAGQAATGVGQYRVAHVLLRVPGNADADFIAVRLKRAQDVRNRAVAGEDFGNLAAAYSEMADGKNGGEMGWRESDKLPELYADAVVKMRPGEVSEVLRSPAGFHVLKLVDRRGNFSATTAVEQTHVRHILVRTNELVSEAEARRKLDNLRERVIQGGDFAELARLNSDDGSAIKGGDLGWVLQGDLVPEFQGAMNALQPGEVSEPVRSPFGLHIIQVLERRVADVAGDRKRLEARRILHERKTEEAYAEWTRQLRDRAFVDYRLVEE